MSGHLCIVGPTAVGKTALACALARRCGGYELVSVDAMAVYRGLDIGTAKPTAHERFGLAWHGLDLIDPSEEFSVATFQEVVREILRGIERRGRRAILVGGSGLYHRALVDDLNIPPRFPRAAAELARRARTEGLGRLYRELAELDPVAAARTTPTNARRILRALEVTLGAGAPFSSFGPGLGVYGPSAFGLVGLRAARAVLEARIAARLDAQLAAGFLDEVRALADRPAGISRTARQALGYRELLAHLSGEVSYAQATEEILRRTRTFARRQESWFRRDPRVVWLDADRPDLLDAIEAIATGLGRSDPTAMRD